ncbi:hypothetical protein Tco_1129661 [Tanacetum coccineum]
MLPIRQIRSRSPRHSPNVFTRLRRERSRSPRHDHKSKARIESTVFKRLGSKGRKEKGTVLSKENIAINYKVNKLVAAEIMREVHYHDWLSNPVMFFSITIASFDGGNIFGDARKLLDVPEAQKPEFPELPKDFPKPTLPDIPKPELPQIPKPVVPDVPKPKVPVIPKPEVPELPKPTFPKVPKPNLPMIPKPEVPKLPKPKLPKITKPVVPEVPKFEVPVIPKPEIPELLKPTLLEVPKPEVLVIPKPALPELPKPTIPEVPKPELLVIPKLEIEMTRSAVVSDSFLKLFVKCLHLLDHFVEQDCTEANSFPVGFCNSPCLAVYDIE